jgi:hypothetical protein
VQKNGDSLEVALFRSAVEKMIADLKAEIAATKPEKKLEKKFDVARRIESLEQRQSISGHLFSSILKKGDIRELLGEDKKKNLSKEDRVVSESEDEEEET